ncbi:hypothetical protein PVAP13_6KG143052 [Panicum virgatum]|uniref:Cytochrome b n=1 Tax=Panicum virgatum TaxID=38727 RepID=A0A8T0R5K4_PANVG|nr:hypothetical protein PVAP13_6KG143052 [Panicum virgatum]
MHHTPHVDLAFNSVEHIMRDVEGGWLLRYMHANGASMFLIVVHLHIFCGLYYASYSSPREFVWCLGVVIFLLMIVTAFIGYVPPWGQMSFWGATVITSLASAIPVVGDTIVTWLWGGFSVDNATLNRFFSLHHLLPLILAGASLLHLAALHQYGSNNPLGVHSEMDKIASYPYFYVKDLVGWVASAIFFSIWIFFAPNVLGHPDNYIPANPMPTPPHIVPEWYFLPIHAILHSIPDKAGGVAAIAPVFISLLALPFFKEMYVRSSSFRPIHQGPSLLLPIPWDSPFFLMEQGDSYDREDPKPTKDSQLSPPKTQPAPTREDLSTSGSKDDMIKNVRKSWFSSMAHSVGRFCSKEFLEWLKKIFGEGGGGRGCGGGCDEAAD